MEFLFLLGIEPFFFISVAPYRHPPPQSNLVILAAQCFGGFWLILFCLPRAPPVRLHTRPFPNPQIQVSTRSCVTVCGNGQRCGQF